MSVHLLPGFLAALIVQTRLSYALTFEVETEPTGGNNTTVVPTSAPTECMDNLDADDSSTWICDYHIDVNFTNLTHSDDALDLTETDVLMQIYAYGALGGFLNQTVTYSNIAVENVTVTDLGYFVIEDLTANNVTVFMEPVFVSGLGSEMSVVMNANDSVINMKPVSLTEGGKLKISNMEAATSTVLMESVTVKNGSFIVTEMHLEDGEIDLETASLENGDFTVEKLAVVAGVIDIKPVTIADGHMQMGNITLDTGLIELGHVSLSGDSSLRIDEIHAKNGDTVLGDIIVMDSNVHMVGVASVDTGVTIGNITMTTGSSFTMEEQAVTGADQSTSQVSIGDVTLINSTLTIKASSMADLGTFSIGNLVLMNTELVVGPFNLNQASLVMDGLTLSDQSLEIRDVAVTGQSGILAFTMNGGSVTVDDAMSANLVTGLYVGPIGGPLPTEVPTELPTQEPTAYPTPIPTQDDSSSGSSSSGSGSSSSSSGSSSGSSSSEDECRDDMLINDTSTWPGCEYTLDLNMTNLTHGEPGEGLWVIETDLMLMGAASDSVINLGDIMLFHSTLNMPNITAMDLSLFDVKTMYGDNVSISIAPSEFTRSTLSINLVANDSAVEIQEIHMVDATLDIADMEAVVGSHVELETVHMDNSTFLISTMVLENGDIDLKPVTLTGGNMVLGNLSVENGVVVLGEVHVTDSDLNIEQIVAQDGDITMGDITLTSESSITMKGVNFVGQAGDGSRRRSGAGGGVIVGDVTLSNSHLTIDTANIEGTSTVTIGNIDLTDSTLIVGIVSATSGDVTIADITLNGQEVRIGDMTLSNTSGYLALKEVNGKIVIDTDASTVNPYVGPLNSPSPTEAPTATPTTAPTATPTMVPTGVPTRQPGAEPTMEPTESPTERPTTPGQGAIGGGGEESNIAVLIIAAIGGGVGALLCIGAIHFARKKYRKPLAPKPKLSGVCLNEIEVTSTYQGPNGEVKVTRRGSSDDSGEQEKGHPKKHSFSLENIPTARSDGEFNVHGRDDAPQQSPRSPLEVTRI